MALHAVADGAVHVIAGGSKNSGQMSSVQGAFWDGAHQAPQGLQ